MHVECLVSFAGNLACDMMQNMTTFLYFNFLFSGCLVQRTGWTRDVDIFIQWLSAIPFSGGGFSDAAIAEGLAEALMVRIFLLSDLVSLTTVVRLV